MPIVRAIAEAAVEFAVAAGRRLVRGRGEPVVLLDQGEQAVDVAALGGEREHRGDRLERAGRLDDRLVEGVGVRVALGPLQLGRDELRIVRLDEVGPSLAEGLERVEHQGQLVGRQRRGLVDGLAHCVEAIVTTADRVRVASLDASEVRKAYCAAGSLGRALASRTVAAKTSRGTRRGSAGGSTRSQSARASAPGFSASAWRAFGPGFGVVLLERRGVEPRQRGHPRLAEVGGGPDGWPP